MSLFGVVGEIVKLPVSIVADVFNIGSETGESYTKKTGEKLTQEFEDIF